MAKMLKLIAEKGVDRELIPLVANNLGLTASGQAWASRSVTGHENNGTLHGFYISRGTEQDLVLSLAVPGKTVYSYRTRRDGSVTVACTIDPQTRQVTMLAPAEAQKSLDVEVAFWTSLVSNQATAPSN